MAPVETAELDLWQLSGAFSVLFFAHAMGLLCSPNICVLPQVLSKSGLDASGTGAV